jgi:carbonic anhydrase
MGWAWRQNVSIVAVLAAMALASPAMRADEDGPTAAEAIAKLKAGNAIFAANPDAALPISAAARAALTEDQAPYAAVLSCADSRVPPEVVFHAALGDLFVARSAGHVADRAVLASLEYAVDRLHVPLVVVMGHESCDAVKTALGASAARPASPNLDYLLKAIRPAVAATASITDATRLRAAILRNIEETVNDLIDDSTLLRHAVESSTLNFVGAYYELSSGRVYFSEPIGIVLQARVGAAH